MDPITFRLFMGSGSTGIVLPEIGASFEGGYFVGTISHTADGVSTHALIVAPRSTGATGTGYTLTTLLAAKSAATGTTGTDSTYDGRANTDAMISDDINNYPAAKFCVDLSIGGYSDWYLPSIFELEIGYYNLKPTTVQNNTSFGINNYSVPKRTSNYTTTDPSQTNVSIFQSGNSEPFVDGSHWTSTQDTVTTGNAFDFRFGATSTDAGTSISTGKTNTRRVRAFRRIEL